MLTVVKTFWTEDTRFQGSARLVWVISQKSLVGSVADDAHEPIQVVFTFYRCIALTSSGTAHKYANLYCHPDE